MRLFWLQTISENVFTPACVFDRYKKLGQTELVFYVDCKIRLEGCKTISAFILPSNELHPKKMEEREREKSAQIAPPPQITPPPQPQIAPVLSHPSAAEITPQIASPRLRRCHRPLDRTLIVSISAPHTQTPVRGPPSRRRSPSHLYTTRSTSLQTHLPFLLFSHADADPRSHRRDRCP